MSVYESVVVTRHLNINNRSYVPGARLSLPENHAACLYLTGGAEPASGDASYRERVKQIGAEWRSKPHPWRYVLREPSR
jgi:hypothetical protein